MDPNHKKTALRMIPYGLYVLTGEAPDGRVAAATVNWVTQTAFEPPQGRPDDLTLTLRDLGEKTFYGG
jgi:hypothetical protein